MKFNLKKLTLGLLMATIALAPVPAQAMNNKQVMKAVYYCTPVSGLALAIAGILYRIQWKPNHVRLTTLLAVINAYLNLHADLSSNKHNSFIRVLNGCNFLLSLCNYISMPSPQFDYFYGGPQAKEFCYINGQHFHFEKFIDETENPCNLIKHTFWAFDKKIPYQDKFYQTYPKELLENSKEKSKTLINKQWNLKNDDRCAKDEIIKQYKKLKNYLLRNQHKPSGYNWKTNKSPQGIKNSTSLWVPKQSKEEKVWLLQEKYIKEVSQLIKQLKKNN